MRYLKWFIILATLPLAAQVPIPGGGGTGGGTAGVTSITATGDITVSPSTGTGNVTLTGTGSPNTSTNAIGSGCGVEYTDSGLIFDVGACTYIIAGTSYATTTVTAITLDAADMTNPRIDAIVADRSSAPAGHITKITGTAAMTPATPSIDSSTQLALAYVLVPAMSTTPGDITVTTIYDENTEWTCSGSATFNCASTTNPYRGTKDLAATNAALNDNFTLVKPAAGTTDLSTVNSLVCYIRSGATWPTGNSGANAARYLTLSWLNGSTAVGNGVVLRDGTFGFSSSVTSNYQQISIASGLFGTDSNLVTTLKGTITGPSGSAKISFRLDACSLQAGTTPGNPNTSGALTYKGAWSSAVAYNLNNVVTDGGSSYAAIATSTNQEPPNATYWVPLGAQSRRFGFSFNGGGSALSGTLTGCTTVPYSGTITGWYVEGDQSGSATIAVHSVATGSYTGTSGFAGYTDVTGGGTAPSLSAAVYNSSTTLTNWVTAVTRGNFYCVQVTSPATVQVLNVKLAITASN